MCPRISKIVLIGIALAAFAVFLAFDTIDSRRRLQSLIGIGVLLSFGFVFSASPTNVSVFTSQKLVNLVRKYILLVKSLLYFR